MRLKIGMVLSQTPTYSETFFNNKIKGLQSEGFEVQLFVQRALPQFQLCKVILLPKTDKCRPLHLIWNILKTAGQLLPCYERVQHYIQLEMQQGTALKVIVKRLYLNAPFLVAKLDWLHFGFATMALQHELVAKAIGAKMAVSCRGYDMDVYPLKHPNAYKLLWQQVDKVHAISNYMQQQALTHGMLPQTPCSIITPAIDIKAIKAIVVEKGNNPTLQLITVARLHWIKGLIPTLEALALLKQQKVDFKYTLIGDGDLLEPLLFAIHQLDLKDQVTILNSMSQQEVWQHLRSSDMYIQYSLSEGFCNAVLEAQACACLCVVSDGGALPENVIHKKSGWVVPKNNPKLLADCIKEVLSLSDDEVLQIKLNATKRLLNHFNLDQQQKAFIEFYTE